MTPVRSPWLATKPSARGAPPGTRRPPVAMTDEVRRIGALPRRPPKDLLGPEGEALADIMTARLAKPPGPCACAPAPCIKRFKPAQAWTLYEAPLAGGVLGNIAVGEGKTLLNILIPMVMPGTKVALFIPPGLRETLLRFYRLLSQHFWVPSLVMGKTGTIQPPLPDGRPVPALHVIPYSLLCRPKSSTLLESLDPDGVIADEVHKISDPATATTARALRLWLRKPDAWFCGWSGTVTSKSIRQFGHLLAWALGPGSPMPTVPDEVDSWACAIDPSPLPSDPGAIMSLAQPGQRGVLEVFSSRLLETRGVVSTPGSSVRSSLNLIEWSPPALPDPVREALRDLRQAWMRPDTELLADPLEVAGCARELACGFYHKWRYPRGEPVDLITQWFNCRKAWHAELRDKVLKREPLLDSPSLCRDAAVRYTKGYRGELPIWEAHTWPAWRDVADLVEPEPVVEWLDEWYARACADWALEHRGIVWVWDVEFGKLVAKLAGIPHHGGGPGAEKRIMAEKGETSIVASIASHGEGRDGLQLLYAAQLVAQPPAGSKAWEQLLGRLHRTGQTADEVDTYVPRHTTEVAEAIDSAVRQAKYVEGTWTQCQKLLAAACDWDLDGEP